MSKITVINGRGIESWFDSAKACYRKPHKYPIIKGRCASFKTTSLREKSVIKVMPSDPVLFFQKSPSLFVYGH